MARRSEHSKEELAELIINAAFKIVKEHGYTELSTRGIAKEVGYAPAMIYSLFSSIEDVIMHLNSRILDMLLEECVKNIKPDADIQGKLYALALCYCNFSQTHFNLWSILFEYRFTDEDPVPEWYKQKVRQVYKFAAQVVQECQPQLSVEEIHSYTTMFWAGVHGIAALISHGKMARVGFMETEEMLKRFIQMFYVCISSEPRV